MKRVLCSLVLSVSLLSAAFYTPKSDALIGVIFKNKVVKTIGGIGALVGGTAATTGLVFAATTTSLGVAILGAVAMVYGGALAGIGLIVLDDNTLADIEFQSLNLKKTSEFEGFSVEEAETYNEELPLLNAIRKTIASEVEDTENTEDAEALWLEYSENLSPATFEIAKFKASQFLKAIAK
jgi:hypothetical protein